MSEEETKQWFDPADPRCKTPYGAVPTGTAVAFTLRPPRREGFVRGELLVQWEFQDARVTEHDLPWTGLDGARDLFSCRLEVGDRAGLAWYSLRLQRMDGSVWESEEYQLTIYDRQERVPAWFGEGVTYQIFPDRFCRLSIPDPTGMVGGRTVHQSWEEEPEWRPDGHGEIRNRDFFGGSLAGIESKLDYLEGLGVETIYLCPIFEAPENHRYGTADYEKIDPMLGCEADFVRLCEKAHRRGMRVMLDGVFNHTGFVSKYFNGDGYYPDPGAAISPNSPYGDWFCFQRWPDQYTSWWGIYSLPTTNKESLSWQEYITGENGIIRRWLRSGADGWRLDVADELPDFVVEAIHRAARAEKPDAVIIGEVWEDASNKVSYSVRRKHVLGGHCDGVMNYPLRTALINFLLGEDGTVFRDVMEGLRQNYPRWAYYSNMNSLGTHDTLRILTYLALGSDHKGDTSRDWRAFYRLSGEERELGLRRLRLGSLLLYALPGSPTLYYGDEAGMEGFEDPFNRRTFPWGREDADLISWFSTLGKLRKTLAPLRRGELTWHTCSGRVVSFSRILDGETVTAVVNAGDREVLWTAPAGEEIALPPMSGALFGKNGREFLRI